MKDIYTLIQTIAQNSAQGLNPVKTQTGIMENETEVRLDPQLTVTPKTPQIFDEGIEVHIEGIINSYPVSGDLVLTRKLKKGDKVKVIKEDGDDKYFITDTLL